MHRLRRHPARDPVRRWPVEHRSRILQFREGGNIFNSLNFSLPCNDLSGASYTRCSTVIQTFLCAAATPVPDGGHDATGDPNGAPFEAHGYGSNSYRATIATAIEP